MSQRAKIPIPWFDRKPVNPFVPIGDCVAIARSTRQGWPSAGACASPLTGASTVAGYCPSGRRQSAKTVIVMAIAAMLAITFISASGALPVHAQSMTGNITNAADPYAATITDASRRFAIPENWIRAVMRAESSDEPSAVSPKGAIGLMKIMPATYDELRLRHGLGTDPFDPNDNIIAGTAYLREMLDRFGGDGFLAAYNAGPQRYEDHLSSGRALPEETVNYVAGLAAIVAEARSHYAISALIGSTFAALAAPSMRSLGGSQLAAELAMPMQRIVDLTALQPTSSAQWDADIYAAPIFIPRGQTSIGDVAPGDE